VEANRKQGDRANKGVFTRLPIVHNPSGHFFTTISGLIARKDCYGWLPANPSTPPSGISRSKRAFREWDIVAGVCSGGGGRGWNLDVGGVNGE